MTDYERTTTHETHADDRPAHGHDDRTYRTRETYVERTGPGPGSTIARIVTFLFGILQALLVLRIVLLLLVANEGNDLVAFVLGATDPFVEPFRGMFQLDQVSGDQGSVLDVAAIVALIGWTLLEAVILAAIRIFTRDRATTTA